MLNRLQMILAFVANLRGFRVAGVISETTIDPQKLGETMARNRGANVMVFTTVQDALAWLGWENPGRECERQRSLVDTKPALDRFRQSVSFPQ